MSSSELTNEHGDQFAAPLDVLRQFARKREMRPPAEQCELCSVEIAAVHRHLLDLSRRTLICVCHPCSILFGDPGHYIVPIDACYELIGLIRLKWKGLSGGEEVWKAIAEFFAGLRKRATPVGKSSSDTHSANRTPWRGESNARPEL